MNEPWLAELLPVSATVITVVLNTDVMRCWVSFDFDKRERGWTTRLHEASKIERANLRIDPPPNSMAWPSSFSGTLARDAVADGSPVVYVWEDSPFRPVIAVDWTDGKVWLKRERVAR